MTWLLGLAARPIGWLAGAGALLAGFAALLGSARRDGRQAARLEQAEQREATRAKAEAAMAEVDGLDDAAVLVELRREFTRPR